MSGVPIIILSLVLKHFFFPFKMKSLFTTDLSWGKKKGNLYFGQKYICAKDVAFNRWIYFKSLILRF